MKLKLKKGLLISIEGIDGSGKSTLCNILADELNKLGFPVIKTKEPGATPLGKELREMLQNRKFEINHKAEFFLFQADRAQNISDIVVPALNSNNIVISDRMLDSTLAYQGYARGINLDFIKEVNQFATDNIMPDLVIYLDIDYNTAIERLKSRCKTKNEKLTFFEKENEKTFKKIINGFNAIFENRDNVLKVDGTKDLDTISAQVVNHVTEYLKNLI